MGRLTWYKRDPTKALKGMMKLTLEERGAYNTILDLIYSQDGELENDDRFIAGWLGVDMRVWRRLRARLIGLGKLYLADGKIHNETADAVVLEALGRVASCSDAGLHSGASRRRKSDASNKEINDLQRTGVRTESERPFERGIEVKNTEFKKEERNKEDSFVLSGRDPDPIPIAIQAYNETAEPLGWPRAQKVTNGRRAALAARLRDCGGVIGWREAMERASASPFLRGDSGRSGGHEKWVPDIDFFLRESSFTKLMEGKYDDRKSKSGNGHGALDSAARILKQWSEAGDEAGNPEALGAAPSLLSLSAKPG